MLDYTALAKARAALAECVALQAKLDAKLREAAAALGVPEAHPDAAAAESPRKIKRWSKELLEAAILRYVSRRSRDYNALKIYVAQGFEGSENTARKIFGRNVIAKRVGAAPSSVGKTSVWEDISRDLFQGTNTPYQLAGRRKVTDYTEDMKRAITELRQVEFREAKAAQVREDADETLHPSVAQWLADMLAQGQMTPTQAHAALKALQAMTPEEQEKYQYQFELANTPADDTP